MTENCTKAMCLEVTDCNWVDLLQIDELHQGAHNDPWGYDAFVANDQSLVGHTIFGINTNSGVYIYHYYADEYYHKGANLKTILKSIYKDNGYLWLEPQIYPSMDKFKDIYMQGEMPYKITKYISGSIEQDQEMIRRLNERIQYLEVPKYLKKEMGIPNYEYAILLWKNCVSISNDFFNEYSKIGEAPLPTLNEDNEIEVNIIPNL